MQVQVGRPLIGKYDKAIIKVAGLVAECAQGRASDGAAAAEMCGQKRLAQRPTYPDHRNRADSGAGQSPSMIRRT